MDISIDTSELRGLAADMTKAPEEVTRKVPPIIKRGATNIANEMRKEMGSSTYFKGAASAITYDILDGGMAVEIGPEKGKPGSLANLAYFGGAYGGGGTVADPQEALDHEEPNLAKFLGDLFDGIL